MGRGEGGKEGRKGRKMRVYGFLYSVIVKLWAYLVLYSVLITWRRTGFLGWRLEMSMPSRPG